VSIIKRERMGGFLYLLFRQEEYSRGCLKMVMSCVAIKGESMEKEGVLPGIGSKSLR
jgi:hypothetical protein